MKCFHIVVSGRVQGVFFRYNTRIKAESLGIKGFVRNRFDRTVEIVAVGDENPLSEFVKFCKKGPEHAHVDKIDIEEIEPDENYENFEILPTV